VHLTCLACSRGVLNIKQTLAGGGSTKGPCALKEVEVYSQMYYANHIKQSVDNAIAEGGITSRGSKLCKCREITAERYEAESIDIKDKVKKVHQDLQREFKNGRKAAEVRDEVGDNTKIKYIPYIFNKILSKTHCYSGQSTSSW
jgi:hypothetical protein